MYRTEPDESRPPTRIGSPTSKGGWRTALWLGLTVALLSVAIGLLTALLSSSAIQPVKARIGVAFDNSGASDSTAFQAAQERLAASLADTGSTGSLVPDGQFWLYLDVRSDVRSELLVEIRHLRLGAGEFRAVTSSGAVSDPLDWHHSKGGVVIQLPASESGSHRIIGHVSPRYTTVLKLFAWEPGAFERSIEGFNRMGGALAGACTVLALTMGLLGLRNRDLVAVLLGLTILLMLRIAAFSSGWDMQWLGIEVPSAFVMTLLRATLPMYAIAQTALFLTLFRKELEQIRHLRIGVGFCIAFSVLLLSSPFVAHDNFLRIWWGIGAPGAIWLIYALARVVSRTKDRAGRLYALSIAVTMAGLLAEIAYMLGYWDTRISASLLGVLFGAAINAAAVAERLYTDRARALEAQRREINALKEKEDVFQSSPVALFEFDAAGRLKHWNAAFSQLITQLHGSSGPAVSDMQWNDFLQHVAPFETLPDHGVIESSPLRPRDSVGADELLRYIDLSWAKEGSEVRGSVQDVTERELARQAMQRLINHDQLTGVLNVHGLLQRVVETREDGKRDQYSLALVDIARFESINELFGHEAGDVVLKSFARRLDGHCRDGELIARVGADTFAVVFRDASIDHAAERIKEIATHATRHPVAVGGKAIALSVCVGVVSPAGNVSLDQAIGASLRTTQRAKRKRSGAVSIALETTESLGAYLNEKRILGRIADRLPTENFFQVMQPIVNIRQPRRKFAAEALIRMRADNGEIIPPGQFIAAAERNGMMPEIDRWTLRTACEWLHEHRGKLDALEYLTVNVSGVSLNDVQFHTDVRAILADFPVEARKLCFEITESIAVSDIEATTRFTEQLRSMGARVALDDFGAGYTSFGYLRTIPAEILKIDGEIIKSVATDPSSTAILRAIRDIASDLGMRCVAEFVSNFDTLRALRELDIDYGQGFVLCRPVEPSRLVSVASGADLINDSEVVRYLDAHAGRSFTASRLRVTS